MCSADRHRSTNLKHHIKKCCLFPQRVAFLGHVLSEPRNKVQEDKVTAIRDWQTPRSLSELRLFLGLCSYYQPFIPGFPDVAAPLNGLRRKHVASSAPPSSKTRSTSSTNCLSRLPCSACRMIQVRSTSIPMLRMYALALFFPTTREAPRL